MSFTSVSLVFSVSSVMSVGLRQFMSDRQDVELDNKTETLHGQNKEKTRTNKGGGG